VEWVDAYRSAIADVEAHIARKPSLDPQAYLDTLETLLLKAARLHRRIRQGGP
jgi:hypothetical protein